MESPTFRALLVEDNPADSFYVSKLLSSVRGPAERLGRFTTESVSSLDEALKALAGKRHDVVLLDLTLPDSRGIETLRAVRGAAHDLPIVVFTGVADVDVSLEALTLGAQDFLSKDNLGPEIVTRTLRYAIERRRGQHALEAAVRERDVLFRELHHRAKNNLQIISSLLNMQARRSDDPRFRALVCAAQERVEAIALAHAELDRAPDVGRIDLSAYLTRLARAAHRAHGGEERGIELELEVDACERPLDQAVAIGLLVNELLTNALKHAFPDQRTGTLRLALSEDEESCCLVVEDDGVGLDDQVEERMPRPLGLELVATLAEQLDSSLEHVAGPGTRFRMVFPSAEKTA